MLSLLAPDPKLSNWHQCGGQAQGMPAQDCVCMRPERSRGGASEFVCGRDVPAIAKSAATRPINPPRLSRSGRIY